MAASNLVENSVVNMEEEVENDDDNDEVEVVSKLPKRPIPAFFLYCKAKKADLPSMTLLDRTQLLSKMWKAASEEEKKIYMDANDVEKERYRSEMKTLQTKHPEIYKSLLAKKGAAAKKKKGGSETPSKDDSTPSKIRGKKRKRPLSPSPPPPPPPLASSSNQRTSPVPTVSSHLKQVKVPGTDVSIFTEEFLLYNKKLNSQLYQMKKTNNDLQSEVSRLEDSISDQEKTLSTLQDRLKTFKEEKERLERNRQKLEESIFKSFGSLANDRSRDITTAEQLLDSLLASGISSRALSTAVKSFIVP